MYFRTHLHVSLSAPLVRLEHHDRLQSWAASKWWPLPDRINPHTRATRYARSSFADARTYSTHMVPRAVTEIPAYHDAHSQVRVNRLL